MYDLTLTTEYGSLSFGMSDPLTISNIEGLGAPEADINLSETALIDGQQYNSAKAKIRTIDMTFAIEYEAEKNRLNVYKVLRIKKPVKLHYVSELRDVFIEGYISKVLPEHFDKKQTVTVTIICPQPYFKSAREVINELSSVIKAFHFPFSSTEEPQIVFGYVQRLANVVVENNGEVDTGLIIELYARDYVSDPQIYNYDTGDRFGLNVSMQPRDKITINTMAGEKTVTLLRNGVTTNIFNSIMAGSKWLQLEGNSSTFVYEVGTGSISGLDVNFKHYDLFEGV